MHAAKISNSTPFAISSAAISFRPEYFAVAYAPSPLGSLAASKLASAVSNASTWPRSPARIASNNCWLIGSGRNLENLFALGQLPSQVIDVKQQHRRWIGGFEFLVRTMLPTVGQIFRSVDIFLEESVLIGNPQIVDHRLDHVQMRNQNGLRKIGRELFIFFVDSHPKSRRGLPHVL